MPTPLTILSYPKTIQLAAEVLAARDRLMGHENINDVTVLQTIFSVGTPGQGSGLHSILVEVGAGNITVTIDGDYTVLKSPIDMVRDAANQWDTPACCSIRTVNPERVEV
jgi:hypothetical protein